MPTLQTYHGTYIWHYVPNQPAAITFAALFGIASLAHGWKLWTTRTWFCLPFFIGGLFEVVGYAARCVAFNATGSLAPYLVQAIFLLLPPVLFAASLYMVYSRVVRAVQGNRLSLISPRWTTAIFILGDWSCLNVQSTGAGLLDKPKHALLGDDIIVAGLGLQVLIFIAFMACCLRFHIRLRAHIIVTRIQYNAPWQSSLNMLYATSLCILVRNLYRMVEFIMGQDGYLLRKEWPTYAFDGGLMFFVMIAFFIWYPSQLQPDAGNSTIELRSDAASVGEHASAEAPKRET